MAINVNNVYQKVLALANKEQRGYITPQEFNLFADQAQLEIFEKYFKQTVVAQFDITNTDDYIDTIDMLKEKIAIHRKIALDALTLQNGTTSTYVVNTNVYAIEDILVSYSSGEAASSEEVSSRNFNDNLGNPLLHPTKNRTQYYRTHDGRIIISSGSSDTPSSTLLTYIEKPATPKWTYVVINNKALYNSSANDAQDFDLHASEENELVIRILELSGITLKDPLLTQIAMRDKLNTKAEKSIAKKTSSVRK